MDFRHLPLYTSSSSSNAGYACVGAGIPGSHVDRTVGIVKALLHLRSAKARSRAEWFA
ncbi:MAG: hypothetical protein ACLR8U_04785 [Oscillospiraceae bacterium]